MRWNEIIKEGSEWNLSGFWITDTGERIEVDHNNGLHHADIALDEFLKYLDLSDLSNSIDPSNDEYTIDMALEAAFDTGWIRVSISAHEVDVTFWKLNKNSFDSLRKHLSNEQPVSNYVLDHVAEFDSLRSLFSELSKIFHNRS